MQSMIPYLSMSLAKRSALCRRTLGTRMRTIKDTAKSTNITRAKNGASGVNGVAVPVACGFCCRTAGGDSCQNYCYGSPNNRLFKPNPQSLSVYQ